MKIITIKWLENKNACSEAIQLFKENSINDPIEIIKYFIKKKEHLDWGNWLIVRIFNKKQKVQYAVFAAKQVISIYERKYPNDDRPRIAIKAAEKYLNNPTKSNKNTAAAAAYAAADAAAAAAYAAADAAAAAAYADAAAYAAAADAAYAADAYAAKQKIRIKILKYGLQLLINKS